MKLNEITNDIDAICKQYKIKNYKINSDGTVDVTGNVDLTEEEFSTLPLKFGKVTGYFNCYGCSNLTTLLGAPSKVGGNFDCGNCSNLTSLEGAPSEITGTFYCGNCSNLTSLEGAPSKVGGNFYCSVCPNLTSLVGAPREVGGNFSCGVCSNLETLVGAPSEVGGGFYCDYCHKLTKLSHLVSINGKLNINHASIINLLAVFGIENVKEITHGIVEITNIINKHLKNPDRDAGMIECRQELKDAGFGEYARLK